MATTLEFLNTRVTQLEKQLDVIINKLQGIVSEAAIQRLTALRQAEYIELKAEVDKLKTIINNLLQES